MLTNIRMMTTRIRIIFAVIALVLAILSVSYINFNDLSWHTNRFCYIGVASMLCSALNMLLLNRYEKRSK
jgi:peptidoglycan/LPS O-acetylase OafA/YrhL